MNKGLIILISVCVVVLIVAGSFIKGLNKVVLLHERIGAAWAQVENQLQRRNDLVPNLVNTVKGYVTHEKEVLERITALRSQWAQAQSTEQKIGNAKEMSTLLGRLFVVVERYPELKANQNFLTLQAQLEGTENRIAVERMRYNNAVRDFNSFIRTIGGGIVAGMRGLAKAETYFEATEAAQTVPTVSF